MSTQSVKINPHGFVLSSYKTAKRIETITSEKVLKYIPALDEESQRNLALLTLDISNWYFSIANFSVIPGQVSLLVRFVKFRYRIH